VNYLGAFEQLILYSVVNLGGDAYGGNIRDDIERRTGRVISAGAINTTLGRLAERRLVTARIAEPTAGRVGRPRKHYLMTPAGARALRESYVTIQAMSGGLLDRLDALASPAKPAKGKA
jgi:DNA-binding PadR family transcriptional regulator